MKNVNRILSKWCNRRNVFDATDLIFLRRRSYKRTLYTRRVCINCTFNELVYLLLNNSKNDTFVLFYFFFFFFLSAIECEASTRAALGLADWNATVHSDTLFQVGNEVCKVIYAHNCYQSCTFHITRGSSKKVLL